MGCWVKEEVLLFFKYCSLKKGSGMEGENVES